MKKMETRFPKDKDKQQMRGSPKNLRRILLLQKNAIIVELKQKYQKVHSAKDKQVASKMLRGNPEKVWPGQSRKQRIGIFNKSNEVNDKNPLLLLFT